MPLKLDEVDASIIRSLMRDARKSFRQVSRETGVSTPTVKARYQRLVRAGLIRAAVLDVDLSKLERGKMAGMGMAGRMGQQWHHGRLRKGMLVGIKCDYCKGQVGGKPSVLKLGNSERLFCCTSCRSLYREKYQGRLRQVL